MKIPHSPRYCKSRFFAEREALANVTTREGTQGAKAPLQSGYFKRGMLNKLLSEGKKMRKFLTALVVVALIATSVLCVACNKDTEKPSAFDALKDLQAAGTIEMTYNESETGIFINTVTYDGLTMGDPANYMFAMLYINTEDESLIDLTGWMGSCEYNGEKFNPSGVGIDKIIYTEGMKLLIVYTVDNGAGVYVPAQGDALLFTLPNGVEKTTID